MTERTQEERRAAFEGLRAFDEEVCASQNYRGCCDAHETVESEHD